MARNLRIQRLHVELDAKVVFEPIWGSTNANLNFSVFVSDAGNYVGISRKFERYAY